MQIEGYTTSECRGCSGSGKSFDSTNQDNATGFNTDVQCSCCSGKGETYRLTSSIEREAREREELEARLAEQEIGEMPAWMF